MSSDFRIESCWPVLPLADVVFFQEGPGLRNWQYRDTGIPFVNIRCIKDGRLLRDEMTCLDPAEVKQKYEHFLLDAGDFVVSSSGTLGRLAEVQSRDLPCMLNTSVIRFRPLTPDRLDRRYLRYFLSSGIFEQQILAFANGSAQLNYGPSHLKRMGIVVPPLSTQQAIGQVLGALDDRISLLRETNATLEAIAQALFKSWFVDFDPVRAKMAGRAPEGMDEATAALFPEGLEETTLGLVPKGWSVKTLADVTAYLNRGISPKYVDDGGLLVLNQKCVRDFSIDWSKGRRHDPNQRKVDGRLLEKGDVLVNSTGVGTLGRVGQILSLPEPAIVDSHVTVVRAGEAVTWSYLGQWMQSREEQIEAMGEGSTGQTELSRSKLGSMPLLVPARVALAAFDTAVLPLKARISCNADTAQSLSSLRDVLLPRLISGQLRLPDAQAQLEDALA